MASGSKFSMAPPLGTIRSIRRWSIVGQGFRQIHNITGVRICLKIAVGRTAGLDDAAALGKNGLFPAVHHFIGAGIVGIAVPDHTVRVQV